MGGGIASIVEAISGARSQKLRDLLALTNNLQQDRQELLKTNSDLRDRLWEARDGVAILTRQLHEEGCSPEFSPSWIDQNGNLNGDNSIRG